MPKLYFYNLGEIDIRAATVLGVNVKEGESPIGFFGTGLKNAIAGVLRLGGSIRIFSGESEYQFSAAPEEIRGKQFNIVHMQSTAGDFPLGFTTELAREWEPWMFYRELRSNAIDERGDVQEEEPTEASGQTVIEVDSAELWEAHLARAEFWLEGEPEWNSEWIEAWKGPSQTLFYHGIRALPLSQETSSSWSFRWNLLSQELLTEDRTFGSLYDIRAKIAKALLSKAPKAVVEVCLDSGMESGLDYDWNSVPPSRDFIEVVVERIRRKESVPSSARAAVRRVDSKAAKRMDAEEVPDTWVEMIAEAPRDAEEITASVYEYSRQCNQRIEDLERLVKYWRACAEKLAGAEAPL